MSTSEERYVEFDKEFQVWAVFGADSGFCYSQHYTKEDAERSIK